MSKPGKSLLRELEDEGTSLTRSNRALQAEVDVLRRQVAQQEKTIVALSAGAAASNEAAVGARHELQLQQASAAALGRSHAQVKEELRLAQRELASRASECDRLTKAAERA
eukprot:4910614-Prymnesium_polylepis.1